MKSVRRGVFETNSSSTHALIIQKQGTTWINDIPLEYVNIRKDWEYADINTPNLRASYIISLIAHSEKYNFKDLYEQLDSLNLSYDFRIKIEDVQGYEPFGYIDDEVDVDVLLDKLFENNITLLNFIISGEVRIGDNGRVGADYINKQRDDNYITINSGRSIDSYSYY